MSFPSTGPSTRDIRASLAWVVATHLFALPYAVYWHSADKLQSNAATWWHNYRATQATHLLNPTLQAHLAAARGICALLEPSSTPGWLVRATTDGTVPEAQYIPLPSISIDVGPLETRDALELGTLRRWRSRFVTISGAFRTTWEQEAFSDAFGAWFLEGSILTLRNYATGNGSLILATPRLTGAVVDVADTRDDADVLTRQAGVSLELEFDA
jgi:hypothetical protein